MRKLKTVSQTDFVMATDTISLVRSNWSNVSVEAFQMLLVSTSICRNWFLFCFHCDLLTMSCLKFKSGSKHSWWFNEPENLRSPSERHSNDNHDLFQLRYKLAKLQRFPEHRKGFPCVGWAPRANLEKSSGIHIKPHLSPFPYLNPLCDRS